MRRRILIFALALASAALAAHLLLEALIAPLPTPAFWVGPKPRVIAHRGGRGLWPENTLFAFEHAAALGADVLEMDLRRSRDGEIVVLHDGTVDRTTDGQGAVSAMRLADIKRLDAGYRWTADNGVTFPFRGQGVSIPSLREVLQALPRARLNLEIKRGDPDMARPLCELITAQGAQLRVAVVSVEQAAIDAFRAACPAVATAASKDEVVRFVRLSKLSLHPLYRPAAYALEIPERVGDFQVLTPGLMRDARRLNLKLEIWTVNDASDMRRLMAMGVDGIMTDFPDRLLALLRRSGKQGVGARIARASLPLTGDGPPAGLR
jgi:glycerophosphoryl diester phosphodiesterase